MTQHERFLARLRASSAGVFAFAYWLSRRGHRVEIGPLRFAPTADQHEDYADSGDLFLIRIGDVRDRIEVKTLSVNFTCVADWPFPEIFVSSKTSVESSPDVVRWVSVSADLTHAALIRPATAQRWRLREKLSRTTGNVEVFYACSLDEVEFCRID